MASAGAGSAGAAWGSAAPAREPAVSAADGWGSQVGDWGRVVMETVGLGLFFEDLPVGSLASRRVIVRWSDGTEGEGLRWYADEVLVCEGDVVGKTRPELQGLHFHRDRDWLQS